MSVGTTNWNACTPLEVASHLRTFPRPWWIAGGWAIDLFVGHETRDHTDTDILILRCDQAAIGEHLKGWDLQKADGSGLRPWVASEVLLPGVNSIWCRPTPRSPWSFEVLLMESDRGQWIYRRHDSIRGLLGSLGLRNIEGLPFLRPEIQLLFKARIPIIDKDEQDFSVALPLLANPAKQWLINALSVQFPSGHPWIERLAGSIP